MNSIVDARYPTLARLLSMQMAVAPDHERFFVKRFAAAAADDLQLLERIAVKIERLAHASIDEHMRDYLWLCNEQLAEELHFRRTGSYTAKSFQEAFDKVYSNAGYMKRYMNGLLMTQLWWSNHTNVMGFYQDRFLATNPAGYSHLEIGPGHGLFLFLAANDPRSGDVCGWDISEASIALTMAALQRLDVARLPRLELVDLFKGPQGAFESVVFSEVLEHMERPREALEVIRSVLAQNGRLFLNMPINSPAPDHLFNADTPEALDDFVVSAGFRIADRAFFPATNQTLATARRNKLTISCVFIAEHA